MRGEGGGGGGRCGGEAVSKVELFGERVKEEVL